MRNSRFTKIVTVLLAMVLLVMSMAVVSAVAEGAEDDYRVTVVSNNVSYDARMEIIYALKCDDLADNEELCLLFYTAAPDVAGKSAEELYASAAYRKTAFSKGETVRDVEDCMLFGSNGIAASKLEDTVYALPVIRSYEVVNEDVAYTYTVGAELIEYSVVDYAEEMLAADGVTIFLTNEQANLFNSLIKYAAAAKKLFAAQ
jgi:hypothetical protein